MFYATQEFVNHLKKEELKYTLHEAEDPESGKDRVIVKFGGENISDIVIQFFFSDDSEDAGVRIFDIVKVPEMKSNKMIKVINDLNNKYRFAKFCLDMKDDTIQLEIDLIFRQHDIGAICTEAMLRALRICDDSYPELMKELWA